MGHRRVVAASLAFVMGGCAGNAHPSVGRATAGLTCPACTDLYVVAHQDDDLLFVNQICKRASAPATRYGQFS